METEKDGSEVQETTEAETEAAETSEAAQDDKPSDEEIADLKRKADASSQNFERAKKAEAELKELREKAKAAGSSAEQQEALSSKDVLALAKADVPEEDLDEVLRVSKILGKNVAETLKDKTMTSILAERAEERRTAAATHTRGGARGASKVSGDDLLTKAERTGEVPETAEGMQALFQARRARKTK